jgi:two-component system chemotaxis response regulator CheY
VTSPPMHFLVVDDIATVRRIIIAMLELLGHTVVSEAEDGAHALEVLHAERSSGRPVDFVITDWNMPVMDGLGLIKAMRSVEEWRDLPVLVISSELAHQNVAAAMEAGANGYISKFSLSADLLGENFKRVLATE